MVELLDREPAVIVKRLLETEWDATNIDGTFDASKRISTGWWEEDNPYQQITVTPVSEDDSYTGIDPSGKGPTSWVDGILDCNVWVPHDRDVTSVHPRSHRWELTREARGIIRANAEGTTDENGNPELTRLEPGRVRWLVDDDSSPVVYRTQLRVRYQWHARP